MSNVDFSAKHAFGGRNGRKKLQLALNLALITAAFVFIAAAVLGVFP